MVEQVDLCTVYDRKSPVLFCGGGGGSSAYSGTPAPQGAGDGGPGGGGGGYSIWKYITLTGGSRRNHIKVEPQQ